VVDVVGVPLRVVALLWRQHLVVVPVDGGLVRRAVGHRRDRDPTGAQPPGAGAPEVRRCHVPRLVQEARLPLVEVTEAEVIRLVAGLHLVGVGELRRGGDEEERRESVVRRGCLAMALGEEFIGPASGGRARVACIYAILCSEATARYAAAQSCRRCSYSTREAR
jgi:hypothetical protein